MTNLIEKNRGTVKITTRVGDSPDWAEKIPIEHYNLIRRQTLQEVLDSAPKNRYLRSEQRYERNKLITEVYDQAISDFKQIIKDLMKE